MQYRKFSKLCSFITLAIILSSTFSGFAAENIEGKLISRIEIFGNYPYIQNKIRRYLLIKPGSVYTRQASEEQVIRIKQFYEREGWFNTTVSYSTEYVESFDSVILTFKIKRGFLLRYRNIDVTGKYTLPKSLVATKLNSWRPYTPRRLREGINKIIETYRNEGFPLARVKLVKNEKDLEHHRIDVTIDIEEGPYVSVHFNGNKNLGGKVLLNQLTIFKEGAIDTFEIEESVKALKKRYKERGFPNAEIDFNRKEISKDYIAILFNIDEGKPERIRNIFINGNKNVSEGKIKDKMVSKSLSFFHRGIFDDRILEDDTKRVTYLYNSKGYLDEETGEVHVEKVENETQLNIILPVVEGEQSIIKDINFTGDVHFPTEKLLNKLKLKIGEPLNATILETERETITRFYADNGYPYVVVNIEIIRDNPVETILNFQLNSGPLVRFGEITITGDFITSQKAIRKAMSVKEGDVFSYDHLAKSSVSLRRLGAFDSAAIDPQGLDTRQTVIPLEVRIEEARPFKLDFGVGYSTDEKVTASIDFANRNSFGLAKRTMFKLKGGQRLSRGEIGWYDPKLVGSDFELAASSWLQYENKAVYNYIQAGIGTSLLRRFHRTSFMAKLELNRNYFLKGSSTAADADSLRNNTIVETGFSSSFDTRNNFAYPLKGIFAMGYLNFYDEAQNNASHFVKFGVTNGLYFTALNRFTFANEIRFDNIQTWVRNTSVPSNELLLLGGDNSLRGFDRNSLGPVNAAGRPTGGRLRFINSTELRIGLFGNFKGIIFTDMGFLTDSYHAVTLEQLRHSAGLGINYVTPIGPIQALYGFVIDRKPGEHIGRFHLQFGYTF